jgi:hypothetical protein
VWQVGKDIERLGWDEDQLRARRLRQETTMSLKWIAARLQMGTWTYVSNLLNEPQKRSLKLRRCCRCVNSED